MAGKDPQGGSVFAFLYRLIRRAGRPYDTKKKKTLQENLTWQQNLLKQK